MSNPLGWWKIQNAQSRFWHIVDMQEVAEGHYNFDKPLCGRRSSVAVTRSRFKLDPNTDFSITGLRFCSRCREKWINLEARKFAEQIPDVLATTLED